MNKLIEDKAKEYSTNNFSLAADVEIYAAFINGAKAALTMEWPANEYAPELDSLEWSRPAIAVQPAPLSGKEPEECAYNFEEGKWDFNGLKTWRLPMPVEIKTAKPELTQLEKLEEMAKNLAKQIKELQNLK